MENENGEDVIFIESIKDDNVINELIKCFERYGWINGLLLRIDEDNVQLRFEKKFGGYITSQILIRYGVNSLYHIINENIKEKILHQGLIPHKGRAYLNPPRIYCFLNLPDSTDINSFGNKNGLIIQINLFKIPKEQKFYFDSRLPNAFYTEEPISPSALKIVLPYSK